MGLTFLKKYGEDRNVGRINKREHTIPRILKMANINNNCRNEDSSLVDGDGDEEGITHN